MRSEHARIALRLACAGALVLATTACNKGGKSDNANAAGEILEGTASDAMLPLDTIRSQPPLAPHSGASKANGEAAPSDAPSESADGDGQAGGNEPPAAAASPGQ